ncbi:MAG TPA: methylmalonyl-CoA decarboxylase [Elusimicrobia bacterium]|nr:methylmalonyl-CoA decarboxylase [Elusimicrobiota bacterium]
MSLIVPEVAQNIGSLTFNNPARRNALSIELCLEMEKNLAAFEKRKLPVVIIRAEKGARVWSSGHDITQLYKVAHDPLAYDSPMEQAFRRVQQYPGVVIAMIQGSVWGGAADLAVICDLTIGDENSSFAITPVKMGLPYTASGIMHFINRVGANTAKEMFFTAEPMKAERSYHCGILNHLVNSREIERFTFEMARVIASHSPLAISVIKEQFRILAETHPLNPDAFERMQALRRKVYNSHDHKEGIKAFLQKRKPRFKGE